MILGYDYETKATFWMDFSIADAFGPAVVRDTYKWAFMEWKSNTVYLTELVMVLNHKIWQWHGKNNLLAETYNDLWLEADAWAGENLTGEDAEYYWRILD